MNNVTQIQRNKSKDVLPREVNSEKQARILIRSLNEEETHKPRGVLEYQAHAFNFRKSNILNNSGIRNLILKRNKLGNRFAELLAKTLANDKFIKKIDVSGNQI